MSRRYTQKGPWDHDEVSRSRAGSPLLDAFISHAHLRCREPRDQIFALLSLSSDAESLGIRPDYDMQTNEVFVQVSRRILSQTETSMAGFLLAACISDNAAHPGVPSWALKPLPPYEIICHLIKMSHLLSTTQGDLLKIKFSSSCPELIELRGHQVSEIGMSTPPVYFNRSMSLDLVDNTYLSTLLRVIANWCRVLSSLGEVSIESVYKFCLCVNNAYQTRGKAGMRLKDKQLLVHPFWLFLRDHYVKALASDGIRELDHGAKDMLDCTRMVIAKIAALLLAEEDGRSFDPDAPLTREEAEALTHSLIWRGRCFGVTACGKVFNAMHETRVGDAVVALEGCADRIWVLRKVENVCWRMVGDVHVPELMDERGGRLEVGDCVWSEFSVA